MYLSTIITCLALASRGFTAMTGFTGPQGGGTATKPVGTSISVCKPTGFPSFTTKTTAVSASTTGFKVSTLPKFKVVPASLPHFTFQTTEASASVSEQISHTLPHFTFNLEGPSAIVSQTKDSSAHPAMPTSCGLTITRASRLQPFEESANPGPSNGKPDVVVESVESPDKPKTTSTRIPYASPLGQKQALESLFMQSDASSVRIYIIGEPTIWDHIFPIIFLSIVSGFICVFVGMLFLSVVWVTGYVHMQRRLV